MWWKLREGVPDFYGLKLSQDVEPVTKYAGTIHKVDVVLNCDRILTETPGVIGSGQNSGFQAINLAAQFGVGRILLVGFDMHLGRGIHWHGKHPHGLQNPSTDVVVRWRKAIDAVAPVLAALGIEVLNCTPGSALTCFPKVDLAEALKG